MKKILRLLTTSVFIVLLATGCSSKKSEKPKVEDKPPVVLYADAKIALASANFEKATEILEALDSRYPFGPHSDQVQLDLIYAYYKQDETALALASINRFMRLNPTHEDLDYLYYMRGLTYMATDQQFFQNLFGIDRFNRDPSNSQQAFKDFAFLVKRYPSSQYAADALQRIVFIKDRLARYELAIGQWYIKREAYIAAINRGKIVLNNYPDTSAVEGALEIMVEGYEALGVIQPKENAIAVLKLNFPQNHLLARYENDNKDQ
ncbi:outer membrane protein assembly factor BamD [Psychromonas antarctica]|jgi:outer membrane protein assembly factor BamD|uniref:outer membrane protein assembly factor BamD n=1 Tax=Psychromonas antarctica TaxID=67573 RepID=UPI001EE99BA9|nr:outer membrane protein assembly factor BamD [Psychromonas antarctica]MCG6201134.1 outer membrane protein assembly factor BamD [Psychromonas antarctica]